jgi:Holliday junction resolvase RusA-like endonuclease
MKAPIHLDLKGHVPAKKNLWHRGLDGRMYFPESAAKHGNTKVQLNALQLQAQSQYKSAPVDYPCSVSIYLWITPARRADLDNRASTLLDVLVDARVLQDDSLAFVRRVMVEGEYHADEQSRIIICSFSG